MDDGFGETTGSERWLWPTTLFASLWCVSVSAVEPPGSRTSPATRPRIDALAVKMISHVTNAQPPWFEMTTIWRGGEG